MLDTILNYEIIFARMKFVNAEARIQEAGRAKFSVFSFQIRASTGGHRVNGVLTE